MKPMRNPVRRLKIGCAVFVICLLGGGRSPADGAVADVRPTMSPTAAAAEAAAPEAPADPTFTRGGGGGLAFMPLAAWCLLVVGWVASTEWLAKDGGRTADFSVMWLPLLTGPFFVVAVGGWWLPWPSVALFATAVAWIAPLVAYVRHRDGAAPADARLCSYARLEEFVNPKVGRFGIRLPPPPPPLGEVLPDVGILTAAEAAGGDRPAGVDGLPGYAELKRIVQRAIAGRATEITIDFDKETGHVSHRIDGVTEPARQLIISREGRHRVEQWRKCPPFGREDVVAVLEALKAVSGFGSRNPTGTFAVAVGRKQISCTVRKETAAAPTRRVVIGIDRPRTRFSSLLSMGMPESVVSSIGEKLGSKHGLLVVSAPIGEGLSTTFVQLLLSADRLCREFVVIEPEGRPLGEMQNVESYRWGKSPHVTAADALRAARLKYPNVICVSSLTDDPPLAQELAALAAELLVIVAVEAGSAVEAIEAVITAGMPRQAVSRGLLMSIGQRLVRKLCPKCAESVTPSAKLVEWLKLADAASAEIKKPSSAGCVDCGGIGYVGRTALFQVATGVHLNAGVARALDHKRLGQAAAQEGMSTFKDVGRELVAKGITSVEEIQRVLKRD